MRELRSPCRDYNIQKIGRSCIYKHAGRLTLQLGARVFYVGATILPSPYLLVTTYLLKLKLAGTLVLPDCLISTHTNYAENFLYESFLIFLGIEGVPFTINPKYRLEASINDVSH